LANAVNQVGMDVLLEAEQLLLAIPIGVQYSKFNFIKILI
jgi:hypothetical protein